MVTRKESVKEVKKHGGENGIINHHQKDYILVSQYNKRKVRKKLKTKLPSIWKFKTPSLNNSQFKNNRKKLFFNKKIVKLRMKQ